MPVANIVRESNIVKTPRVIQLEGYFDIESQKTSKEVWEISFTLPDDWNIGVIVGPSGCGKTTIANELFPENIITSFQWADAKSVVDDFPKGMSIKDICNLLSSVGFSSPPSWLKPFRVLSNGEQFRVTLARAIAESKELVVFDEFSSVVDRTVAQIGSAAVSKTIRKRGRKFIAVTCHYDVLEWLEPDWIYEPHINKFYSGRYLQRPRIQLEIYKVSRDWWGLFRKHHYLNTTIATASLCFLATWNGQPVGFVATMSFPHPKIKKCRREHRLVCLPDFQGVGIGNALSNWMGDYLKSKGYRYKSMTSHPAMIAYRNTSPLWKMTAKPNYKSKTLPKRSFSSGGAGSGGAGKIRKRLMASFEYIG